MIYLIRLIIWISVIAVISWILHYKFKKYVKYEKLKPFTGVMVFFVIMLTPMTIAKTAQLYYCWKYKPFYKIIKPLPEDFEGFYGSGSLEYLDKYPKIIKYADYQYIIKYAKQKDYVKDVKEGVLGVKPENIDKKLIYEDEFRNKYVYVRQFIDKKGSKYCIKPNKKIMGKVFLDEYKSYFNQNKCIARKIIPKSEVSRYMVGFYDDTIVDIYPFQIPGIVRANYYKFKVVMNRLTREYYAWRAGVRVEWDLYGVLGHEGAKLTFGCWSGVNVVDKLIKSIKQRGENNGK